jgi:hypothetical protein
MVALEDQRSLFGKPHKEMIFCIDITQPSHCGAISSTGPSATDWENLPDKTRRRIAAKVASIVSVFLCTDQTPKRDFTF